MFPIGAASFYLYMLHSSDKFLNQTGTLFSMFGCLKIILHTYFRVWIFAFRNPHELWEEPAELIQDTPDVTTHFTMLQSMAVEDIKRQLFTCRKSSYFLKFFFSPDPVCLLLLNNVRDNQPTSWFRALLNALVY